MISGKGGVELCMNTPSSGTVNSYNPGDILVSNIRPYFKKIWRANRTGTCSNDILVFRADESACLSEYLHYTLSNDAFFDFVMGTSKGTKMPRGDKDAIMQYMIELPSISNQRKIAEVLSSLDGAIYNNHHINDYLAEIARLLFSHYMKLSGRKECCLSDIVMITMGQSPPGDSYNEEGEGTLFYQGRAEFGTFFPSPRLYTTQPKRMAQQGDILMSVRAPVGDINIALNNCCIGRGLASIRSNGTNQGFIHYLFESLKTELSIYENTGTVFGSINKDSLNNLKVSIPQTNEADEYNNVLSMIDEMIKTRHKDTILLIQMKNLLLPKLMSKEIDVSNLDLGC